MFESSPALAAVAREIPERDTPDWDRAVARLSLDAQIQLLPYALGFFGICLPIFVAVAGYAPNAVWLAASLGVYGFNWAVFYAIVDWRKKNEPSIDRVRLHTAVHVAAGLLWALAIVQTVYFAQGAGPFRELLLILCAGAAIGVIFFTSPNLPSLLIVGPTAAAGPVLALRFAPDTAQTGLLILCGTCLAMALALILNRHLRQHFALALEREGLIVEREGALVETRRLAKSKSDIVATLSHEIRNGLSGMAHVLAGALGAGSRGAPSREQLKAALSAARDLVEVLDATLDSEVAEAGRLKVALRPIDAARLVHDTALLQRGNATAKGLEITAQVDSSLSNGPGAVVADSARARQILNNLVGNAVKYTVRGRIEIRAFRLGPDKVRFEVADTGPGLSEDELRLAFQPFERVARTGAGVPGAGLGLSLSRRLAALMQGELGADSAPGVGSRFWVDLTFDPEAAVPETPVAAPAAAAAPERPLRVLVAEDDQLNAAMMRAVLEQLGHKVVHVQDGRRAVEMMRMGEFDLIMIDGRMPVMDGPQTVTAVRAMDGAPAGVPIVGVIGGDADEAKAMLDAGADSVLRKPVTVTAVARAVADAAHRNAGGARRAVA